MRIWLPAVVLAMLLGCNASPGSGDGGTGGGSSGGGAGGGGAAGGGSAGGGSGGDGGLDGGSDAGPATPRWVLPPFGVTRAELGVLVNSNDPLSVAVATRYMQARGIPAEHRIDLSFPVTAVMSRSDFAVAKAVVNAHLDGGIQALALTWTTPYRVDCMSVTTAFAITYDAGAFCSTPCMTTAPVRTYDSASHRLYDDYGVLPTMMIAASDAGNAFTLIDRGIAADGTLPTGEGWFLRTTDVARSVRYFEFEQTVQRYNDDGGLSMHYLDNVDGDAGTDQLTQAHDVLFYFTGLADVPGIGTDTYRPGAVADHLTSYGGEVPNSGQMSCLRWLEAGVTASYGTVVEPCNYTGKFPETTVLVDHYFRGEPIIEAYWKSVSMPGEGLFIGEPLASPFARDVTAYDAPTQTLSLTTNRIVPFRSYTIESADAPQGPWSAVRDAGVVTLLPRRVTLTVSPATARYYRLSP